MAAPMIVVWRFEDAPGEYQAMSENGGDEDWLALVPPELRNAYIPWLDSPMFGVSAVDEFDLSDGSMVVIGSHA